MYVVFIIFISLYFAVLPRAVWFKQMCCTVQQLSSCWNPNLDPAWCCCSRILGSPTDTSYVFVQQLFFCGISCRRQCLALQRALLWKLLKIFLLWEEGYDTLFVNNIKYLYVSYLYEVLAIIYTVLKKLRVDDLLEKRKLLISFSLYIV